MLVVMHGSAVTQHRICHCKRHKLFSLSLQCITTRFACYFSLLLNVCIFCAADVERKEEEKREGVLTVALIEEKRTNREGEEVMGLVSVVGKMLEDEMIDLEIMENLRSKLSWCLLS